MVTQPCPECGEPTSPRSVQCPFCGHTLSEGTAFQQLSWGFIAVMVLAAAVTGAAVVVLRLIGVF
jgi:hypothetical protein